MTLSAKIRRSARTGIRAFVRPLGRPVAGPVEAARSAPDGHAAENAHLRVMLDYWNGRHRSTIAELQACAGELGVFSLEASEQRNALLANLMGTSVSEALYILHELRKRLRLAGAVAEFGVAQGATSALIANELRETDKELWLFDSFQGLPAPTAEDVLVDDIFGLGSMEAYEGTMASPQDEVLERLRAIDMPLERVRVVPGFVEETIGWPGLPERFCFAYVDLDLYRPIKTVLEVIAARLVKGGALIVDDYGHFSAGAQRAVDEFLAEHEGSFERRLPRPWAGKFVILERS